MIIKLGSLKLLSEMQRGGNEKQYDRTNDNEPAFISPIYFPPCLPKHKPNTYHSFSSITNFEAQAEYDQAATGMINATATGSTIPSITISNKRILIVDDDYDIARLFKIALERVGFIVDVFNDPLASLSNYKTRKYIFATNVTLSYKVNI
jgi:PleD family two-component response regulator